MDKLSDNSDRRQDHDQEESDDRLAALQAQQYWETLNKRPTQYRNSLPPFGYLRLKQILGDSKADPPTPPIIPVSKTTWWNGVKSGRFPKPADVDLGPGITVWTVESILGIGAEEPGTRGER